MTHESHPSPLCVKSWHNRGSLARHMNQFGASDHMCTRDKNHSQRTCLCVCGSKSQHASTPMTCTCVPMASTAELVERYPKYLSLQGETTFLVGFVGWGTVEEDLYQVTAKTPEDAINEFIEAVEQLDFTGHGHDPRDRDRILVYAMAELGEWIRVSEWKRV